MTIREVSFVYPLLNAIAQSNGLKEIGGSRQAFINGMAAKLRAEIDSIKSTQEALIVEHGQRDGDLERFKLKTKEQVAAFKMGVKQYKGQESPVNLTKEEAALFDSLLYQALLGGYEDFPEV